MQVIIVFILILWFLAESNNTNEEYELPNTDKESDTNDEYKQNTNYVKKNKRKVTPKQTELQVTNANPTKKNKKKVSSKYTNVDSDENTNSDLDNNSSDDGMWTLIVFIFDFCS